MRPLALALAVLALAAPPLAPAPAPGHGPAGGAPGPGADPAEAGRWGEPFEGEVPGVNVVLLRDGRVLAWSGEDGRHAHAPEEVLWVNAVPRPARARLLDLSGHAPAVRTPAPEDGGAGDMFCSGQAALPDGRVLVAGGTRYASALEEGMPHLYGIEHARRFDPASGTFAPAAPMGWWRWYPTLLALPDGDVLALGGTQDFTNPWANLAYHERYDAAEQAWADLPHGAERALPTYPRAHVVPSGPLAGQVAVMPGGCMACHPLQDPAWHGVQTLDLEAAAWTEHPGSSLQGARDYGGSVLLALRPPAYPAEVLLAGGALGLEPAATPLAERVSLAGAAPEAALTAPMVHARWHPGLVLLPTGEVLATGGTRWASTYTNHTLHVLEAELYDPDAPPVLPGLGPGAWRALAPMQVGRGYHSSALLLADGRVLVGGNVPFPTVQEVEPQAFETRYEVFEPPYLFRGPRPVVGDAPAEAGYGTLARVASPDAARVTQAVLMRPGAATHAFDGEQRAVELAIEGRDALGLDLRMPPGPGVAPPGWYMLFLLAATDQGPVPSAARFLRLG